MKDNVDMQQGVGAVAMKSRPIIFILAVFVASMTLSACDHVLDMVRAEPQTEITGPLVVVAKNSAGDASRMDPNSMPTVTYQAMIEYAPGSKAVIYTSPQTEYVNVEREDGPIAYFPGGTYRVEGKEMMPANARKTKGGDLLIESPVGVDKWIEVSRMEFLENPEQAPPD